MLLQLETMIFFTTALFYSRCKKCDIEKTLGGVGTTHPLGSPKVKLINIHNVIF